MLIEPARTLRLADGDPDVVLDVQTVVEQAYEAGSSRERLRYDRIWSPALSAGDLAWADERICMARQSAG